MRADAQRNHLRILDAARELFAEVDDPSHVSMEAIAAAAGVGKGTLFRRFGSREALVAALFEERSRELYTHLHHEGDELTPVDRVTAMLTSLIRAKQENRALATAIDRQPHASALHKSMHTILRDIIVEERGIEYADFFAEVLLSAVRSDLIEHPAVGESREYEDGLTKLVEMILTPDGPASAATT